MSWKLGGHEHVIFYGQCHQAHRNQKCGSKHEQNLKDAHITICIIQLE